MADSHSHIVVKRKNLMSLFREDDRADAESRGLSYDLKDALIKKDDSADAKVAQSLFEPESKLGLLVQVFHLWACGSQASSPHSIIKKGEDFSRDCYQDAEFSTLVVRHGDCLSEISRLVGIPMEVLQRVNSIANIEHLKVAPHERFFLSLYGNVLIFTWFLSLRFRSLTAFVLSLF